MHASKSLVVALVFLPVENRKKMFGYYEIIILSGLSKTQTLQQLSNSNQTGFIGFSLMFSRLKIKLNKIVSQLGRRIKVLLLSKDSSI